MAAELVRVAGEEPNKLANAISDAFFASGLPVDEAACIAIAVIADYARAEYGESYLLALVDIIMERGNHPLPQRSN